MFSFIYTFVVVFNGIWAYWRFKLGAQGRHTANFGDLFNNSFLIENTYIHNKAEQFHELM